MARYRLKYVSKGHKLKVTNQIQSRGYENTSIVATIFTLKFRTKNACRSIDSDLATHSTILDTILRRFVLSIV